MSQLTLDRVKFLTEQLKTALPNVRELDQAIQQLEGEISNDLMQLAVSMKLGKNVDRDAIEAFKKRPFTFTPYVNDQGQRREGWYFLIIPRFVDMQIGWLEKQDLSFNHFVVNRWLELLGELPELIKKELGIKPPPHLEYADGVITGEASDVDAFARNYPKLIASRRGNRLVSRPKRYFEVLAALIKEGVRPFHEQPVPRELLTERKCDIKLKAWQEEAWQTFLKYSNMGIFWPASVGKSLFGVWLPTRIKPPTLVTVPTVLLKETWEERIKLHTDLKLGEEIEVLVYWTAIKKYADRHKQFNLKIYEECHHLPADDLSRLTAIPSATSVGLTACVSSSSKILCNNNWNEASALIGRSVQLYGVEERTLALRKQVASVVEAHWLGNKSPFHVMTNVRSIACTGDHPFLVWKWGKGYEDASLAYVDAKKLRDGDIVAVACLSPLDREHELVCLLGFGYGDSHLRRPNGYYRLTFTVGVGEETEIGKALDRLGYTYKTARKGDKSSYSVDVHGQELGSLFSDRGMSIGRKTSQPIRVPVLNTVEEKELFLSGLFGAEGSAPRFRKRMPHYFSKQPDNISLIMTTEDPTYLRGFFEFLHESLSYFKIDNVVDEHTRSWINAYGETLTRYAFLIRVGTEPENLIRFFERIEYAYSPHKQERANEMLAWLYCRQHDTQLRCGRIISHNSHTHMLSGRTQLRSHSISVPPVSPYIRWERLMLVERLHEKFPLVDVHAPVTRNFIANGFVTHNSPQRQDKREEYIFAFTGQSFGLSWDYFRKLNLIRNPICNVWIVKSIEAKVKYIGELAEGKRTLVFCDSIELGTIVSKRYDIPHVHGATKKDRLKTIKDAPLVVVSRVGDEGISLPEVEQIIEISWLGRSRRQQLQRFTRLLHSRIGKAREEEESVISDLTEKDRKEIAEMAEEEARLREPSYHILMTLEEYVRDRQRLFSVMDKGFKVEIHREGVSERQFTRTQEAPAPMRTPKRIRVSMQAPSETQKPISGTEGSVQSSAMFASLPPGMQKLILSRNEPERKLIVHLYSRDGEWQPMNMLYLALNYTSRANMTSIDFADLERKRIIQRKRGYVRTNFRGLKE